MLKAEVEQVYGIVDTAIHALSEAVKELQAKVEKLEKAEAVKKSAKGVENAKL